MRPVQNPVNVWSVRPAAYSRTSNPRVSITPGVSQPAHGLSRGNEARSRIKTSRPASRSRRAHEEPAGPPPTIRTSQLSIRSPCVQSRARPRQSVHRGPGEHDLEELHRARQEGRLRAREVEPPGPRELLAIARPHSIRRVLVTLAPMPERARIVA